LEITAKRLNEVSVCFNELTLCAYFTGQELTHVRSHNSYLVQTNEKGMSKLNEMKTSNMNLEEVKGIICILIRSFCLFKCQTIKKLKIEIKSLSKPALKKSGDIQVYTFIYICLITGSMVLEIQLPRKSEPRESSRGVH